MGQTQNLKFENIAFLMFNIKLEMLSMYAWTDCNRCPAFKFAFILLCLPWYWEEACTSTVHQFQTFKNEQELQYIYYGLPLLYVPFMGRIHYGCLVLPCGALRHRKAFSNMLEPTFIHENHGATWHRPSQLRPDPLDAQGVVQGGATTHRHMPQGVATALRTPSKVPQT